MKVKKILMCALMLSLVFLTSRSLPAQDVSKEARPAPPQETTPTQGAAKAQPQETSAAGVQTQGPTQAQPPETAKEEAPAQTPASGLTETKAQEVPQDQEESKEAAPALQPGNVTVNFKGADIRTVLSYISEVAGVDIVPAPDVKGPVDVKLTDKPWKVALDIIVRNYGFAYEREGDIIRVDTVDKLKQQELVTQPYSLNYGTAKDIASVVKDMVGERGKITHDERTNVVLVTDVPTNIYKIGQVIEKLDSQTPQVLIEAKVLETILEKNENMGIDWTTKLTAKGAKRPITAPFYNFTQPFGMKLDEKNFLAQAVSNNSASTARLFPSLPKDGSFGFPYAATTDFKFGTLDFSEFAAVLEMLKNRTRTEVISNPRISTLNNKPAHIFVGQNFNIPTYARNTTSGIMEIAGYTQRDVGVTLDVTPRINPKGEIVVEIKPEISAFLRYDVFSVADNVRAPIFTVRTANTQVMVKDGDTIFIGGLITENNSYYKSRLPFLGDMLADVPGLGFLFSKKEDDLERVELIFFITVHLVTQDKQIKDLPNSATAYSPVYSFYKEQAVDKKKKRPGRSE